MTILRDQNTERGDFIFYADRLSTLVVEKALELIPYRDKTVKAPTGASFQGFEKTAEVGLILSAWAEASLGTRRNFDSQVRWPILAWPASSDSGRADRCNAHPVGSEDRRAAVIE